MKDKLEKILNSYADNYTNWLKVFNQQLESIYSTQETTQDEDRTQLQKMLDIFTEFAKSSISYGNFKDVFEYNYFNLNVYGPELIINSQKTGTVYNIGFDEKGVYISTYLKHSFSLKNMDDNFWALLLSLNNYGEFELEEREHFGKEITRKYPELFNNQKGTIFRMLRKYFISFLTEDERKNRIDRIGILGDFRITWNSNFKIDKILEECCEVFKILYKLNYCLWKIEDAKSKVNKQNCR